jgi:hypothetical protein
MTVEHFDVVVVGAGLSGIGAGYHLQTKSPDRSYVILEGRSDIGGTWDLFRYPGVRSDSDMHTLGFSFNPWTDAKSIADGPSILQYLRDTVREFGIDKHIRFNHRITNAEWSTADSTWTVTATRTDATTNTAETLTYTCGYLFMCSGYYSYKDDTSLYGLDIYLMNEKGGATTMEVYFKTKENWLSILELLDKPENFLSSVQVGITLIGIVAGAILSVKPLSYVSKTFAFSFPNIKHVCRFIQSMVLLIILLAA